MLSAHLHLLLPKNTLRDARGGANKCLAVPLPRVLQPSAHLLSAATRHQRVDLSNRSDSATPRTAPPLGFVPITLFRCTVGMQQRGCQWRRCVLLETISLLLPTALPRRRHPVAAVTHQFALHAAVGHHARAVVAIVRNG